MKLNELLSELKEIAEKNNLSTPYIVGGFPRDILFGESVNINDIDITTGDSGALALGMYAAERWPDASYNIFEDAHSSLDFKNIKIDFSNNFHIPGITDYLEKSNINNPSELEKEIYSRDFTINTLLQPLDLDSDIIDITKYGKRDVENKILRTPIDPELTIGHDPKRIIRALKLVVKYDLNISKDLHDVLLKYRGGVSDIGESYIKKNVNRMLEINPKRTIKLLYRYKLLSIIPLSQMMNRALVNNKMTQFLLDG